MGTASRSRCDTVNIGGKEGTLETDSEFPSTNKWPKISDLCNPIHLTQVGFNSSTSELIGLPEEEQLLLQDSGTSKFDQERDPLAVTEAIKFYQGDGGDVWDGITRGYIPTPDISQLSPVPGLALPSYGTVGPINVHFAAPVSVVFFSISLALSLTLARKECIIIASKGASDRTATKDDRCKLDSEIESACGTLAT